MSGHGAAQQVAALAAAATGNTKRRMAPSVAISLCILGVTFCLWEAGVLSAAASRVMPAHAVTSANVHANADAVVDRAVRAAEDRARIIVAQETSALRTEMQTLTTKLSEVNATLAGMAGEMRAWRDMRKGGGS